MSENMRVTSFVVKEAGTVLYDYHLWRLREEGLGVIDAFQEFAAKSEPGVYRATAREGRIEIIRRSPSKLYDKMPVRTAASPYCGEPPALFPKPGSPCRYDGVRLEKVATLLTSADGQEYWESCSASLVGWDGEHYILVPENRPRVASVSEQALRKNLYWKEAPLRVKDSVSLALINAVKGVCIPEIPGREPFPENAKGRIEKLFEELTRRPGGRN